MTSPSRWSHRAPLLSLAVLGCAIATYLTLYQVGALSDVWDPIFGSGSQRVLTSSLSRSLPIPDALLGALAYLADILLGGIGGADRWRSMPWLVLAFGVVVAGLVLAALGLIATQVLIVHAGCALCLASAAISLATGWLARDEVLAAVRLVRWRVDAGASLAAALRGGGGDGKYTVEDAA